MRKPLAIFVLTLLTLTPPTVRAAEFPAESTASESASDFDDSIEDIELDEDELLLIELRRRALEAEMAEDNGEFLPAATDLAMSTEELDALRTLPGNIGPLPAHPDYPADNLPTPQRIELGRKLYFDRRLSRDHSMSCATCHDPNKGWSDGLQRSKGFKGEELGRHSPTVLNTAFNTAQFWDSRADTLEQQAVGPIMAAGEMNMPSVEEVLHRISSAPEYEHSFETAYQSKPSMEAIGKAIAAFERTVISGRSKFDDYCEGKKDALSDSEKRGLILFTTTASCTACHKGPNFTDSQCYSLGVRQEGPLQIDAGRFNETEKPIDRFAFKTPGLRNIAETAPYMHDGSLATLEEVVEFYNKGGERNTNRSKLIHPLNLTDSQKGDLVAFLRSLSGPLPKISSPKGTHFGI